MANRKKVSKKQGDKGGPGKNGLRPTKKGQQPRNGRNRRGPLPGMEPGYWEGEVVHMAKSALAERLRSGKEKYGDLTPLKKTASDWLIEAMEEALDNIVYLHMAHVSIKQQALDAREAIENGDFGQAQTLLRLL